MRDGFLLRGPAPRHHDTRLRTATEATERQTTVRSGRRWTRCSPYRNDLNRLWRRPSCGLDDIGAACAFFDDAMTGWVHRLPPDRFKKSPDMLLQSLVSPWSVLGRGELPSGPVKWPRSAHPEACDGADPPRGQRRSL